MLENDDFVEWANENIVVVVGHNEEVHAAEVEDAKGKKVPGCPLYRGLQCKEHRDVMQQVGSPPAGMPKVEVGNGMPNSWLILPDGTVEEIQAAQQQVAGKVQELIEAKQKVIGKVMPWKKYEKYRDAFAEGQKAVEAGDWKDAVRAYGLLAKDAAKLPEPMAKRVTEHVAALDAKVLEAFEAAKAIEDPAARDKEVKALRAKVAAKVGPQALPALAQIDVWLKANPFTPPK